MQRNRLGERIRELRKRGNVTGQELADRLGLSQSKISKIENGKLRPTRDFITQFAKALGLSKGETQNLLAQAEIFLTEFDPWRWDDKDAIEKKQQAVSQLEESAHHSRSFQSLVIPGLLQTQDYAEAVITHVDLARTANIDAAVRSRMQRQKILARKKRCFSFLISESVLRTRICDTSTMVAQIEHLASIESLGNVSLGLIPWSARYPRIPVTSFDIFDDKLVTIETLSGEVTVWESRAIGLYLEVFEALTGVALTGDELAVTMDRIANEYRHHERDARSERKIPGTKPVPS